MSDTVIKVENLSKLYRLGEIGTGTLSHDLNRWWAKLRGKEDPYAKVGQINDRTKQLNPPSQELRRAGNSTLLRPAGTRHSGGQAIKQKNSGEYVWALKDINFEVKKREVFVIIDKNGAEISTLLKIPEQITCINNYPVQHIFDKFVKSNRY
jgi:lipopolysaccharide transport system ATP-binding protein